MDGDSLDVADSQPMSPEQGMQGAQGEIAEMLVVDGVELDPLNHLLHVWDFDHRDAVGLQQDLNAFHEPVQVGDVRQHVVGDDHVCCLAAIQQLASERRPEELAQRPNTSLLLRHPRDVLRRLYTEHRDPRPHEVLEQIPVVAGQFDDQTLRSQCALPNEPLHQRRPVSQHRIGERREVRIFPEERLGGHGLENLDKPAVFLFPKLLVCLDCGFTEFTITKTDLRLLGAGVEA